MSLFTPRAPEPWNGYLADAEYERQSLDEAIQRLNAHIATLESNLTRLCGPVCPHDGKRAIEHGRSGAELIQALVDCAMYDECGGLGGAAATTEKCSHRIFDHAAAGCEKEWHHSRCGSDHSCTCKANGLSMAANALAKVIAKPKFANGYDDDGNKHPDWPAGAEWLANRGVR